MRRRHFHVAVRFGAAWLIVLGVLGPTTPQAPAVEAASLIVNTTADPNSPGDGLCSLREAINNANTDLDLTSGDCVAGSGADIITFSVTGIISLTQVPATLTHALPTITTHVTLIGPGAANLTIRVHANSVGVFAVGSGGTFTLSGLRVADGLTTGSGGGIFNDGGTVTVADSVFSNNRAINHGGAIYSTGGLTVSGSTFGSNNTDANGGGIYSTGSVVVNNSTFSNNQADGSGGAIYGAVEIVQSTFTNNSAGGDGGGIYTDGGSIANSIFSNNGAGRYGGGVINAFGSVAVTGSTFASNTAAYGGAILNEEASTLTILGSTFSANSASNSGGGIFNLDGYVTVTSSTISGNSASALGGGIYGFGNTTIVTSTLSGNSANRGGGIYNDEGLGITDSLLVTNTATLDGGGIYIGTDGGFNIANTTLSANTAMNNGGGFFHSSGASSGLLANITFYGNGAASGGAIFNETSGLVLTRTLIAYSTSGANCAGPVAVTDGGYNVQTASLSCGNTIPSHASTASFCSLLDPLQYNGGPTKTHALRLLLPDPPCPPGGNPAIDTVPLANCALSTDQRGAARPHGVACDIGAFEFGSIAPGYHVYLPLIVR
ncbi:MAG: choice-of-anchor Q domain-containing protein [Anaerolineales bacterium]